MSAIPIPQVLPPELKRVQSWDELNRWGTEQDRFQQEILASLRAIQRELLAPAPPSPALATIGGKGNIKGPASSVIGDIATWNNTAGSKLADGGVVAANLITSSAVLADKRILRGDGGARGIQGSAWTIEDTGEMTTNFALAGGVSQDALDIQADGTSLFRAWIETFTVKAAVSNRAHFEIKDEGGGSSVSTLKSQFNSDTWKNIDGSSNEVFKEDFSNHSATVGNATGYVGFTAYRTDAIRFLGGQDGGSKGDTKPGVSFVCDGSDGGSPAANEAGVSFIKNSNDAVNMPAFGSFTFRHTGTFGASAHFGGWMTTGGGDAMLTGVNQAGRICHHDLEHSSFLDSNSRWQKVDGLPGGGFGYIDAGTSEPVTT